MEIDPSIVVLSYNKPGLTECCINSILRSGYSEAWVTLVDNGSRPEAFQSIREKFPGIHILRLERNCGFAGGFNSGLNHVFDAGYTSAFFASNDTELTPGVVETCRRTGEIHGAGLVAPAILMGRRPYPLNSVGGWFDRRSLKLNHYRERGMPTLLKEDDYVPGAAFWITRDAFKMLQGADPEYHTYWEDADLSFRAAEAAIALARTESARVLHKTGQTCRKKHRYTTYYYRRNRIRFCRRHLNPDEWRRARRLLSSELDTLEQKWIAAHDGARLSYLPSLRDELQQAGLTTPSLATR